MAIRIVGALVTAGSLLLAAPPAQAQPSAEPAPSDEDQIRDVLTRQAQAGADLDLATAARLSCSPTSPAWLPTFGTDIGATRRNDASATNVADQISGPIADLRQAVRDERKLRLRYETPDGEMTERVVRPVVVDDDAGAEVGELRRDGEPDAPTARDAGDEGRLADPGVPAEQDRTAVLVPPQSLEDATHLGTASDEVGGGTARHGPDHGTGHGCRGWGRARTRVGSPGWWPWAQRRRRPHGSGQALPWVAGATPHCSRR